ncbi:hypothetical protein TNCV_3114831 [Trichonephila clavipes]|nr:hypothetical protein TNCV_3114831 [Trichonephila clavipes]
MPLKGFKKCAIKTHNPLVFSEHDFAVSKATEHDVVGDETENNSANPQILSPNVESALKARKCVVELTPTLEIYGVSPIRVEDPVAWRSHPSICNHWALRCESRCPDHVVSLKRDPQCLIPHQAWGTHLSTHCSKDERLSRPCPAREKIPLQF